MAETPRLRRAGADDAAKLALLGQATFLTAFAHDHPGDALVAHCTDQHSESRYAAWAVDPATALWIIETPLGAPIGYAMMTEPELDVPVPPGGLELKRIYALTGWQNAGLGRRLVEAVIEEARARGANRLYLCVYEVNVAARRFYERFGFARIGTQKFMVGDTAFTDHIMARDI
ncbi:GNAT family N-acetyltransferase [Sphingobium boeckii]|uniref:Ribosomal protein S18 acetylase RimI-like enzyme n=1 Tax=Sphingobium boeckii TaxID=1082345 RepID=A0A7W9AL84_9SPHN|nr:GNAT family N-acetyltransferase [Sphingobium boeckii]MBB5687541.1 ribosomal protein S18 acetylase RimI-like enzyme [Sphingobium boeckii]